MPQCIQRFIIPRRRAISGIIQDMTRQQKRLTQQQFGANAEDYISSSVHAGGYSLKRLLEITDPQPDWLMLDIATGVGHTALTFAPFVRHVTALDLTHPMLLAARQFVQRRPLGPRIDFCRADAEALPLASSSYDLVTCRIAPHHFNNIAAFVGEVVRVLRPGGVFGLADNVVGGDPAVTRYVNAFERYRDPSHVWAYSLDDWLSFFSTTGLVVTHSETFQKEMVLDEWAARMNVSGDGLTRLRILLLQSPAQVQAWLQPRQIGLHTSFKLTEALVIGQKTA